MSSSTITRQPETAAATTWRIDPAHSQVEFAVTHLMFSKVRGRFRTLAGTLELGPGGDATRGRIATHIPSGSIDTGNTDRDAHLRSADFLDAEHFPELRFESTKVVKGPGGALTVSGDLTIRGVTRPIQLAVVESGTQRDPWGHERVAYSATTAIDRRDFGLTWNQALETGGVMVGHEVQITLEVEAVREDA
jgi:polyisoprenoid-binding protein YceI